MIGWVRPGTVIPVHGEALHLAEHAALARRLQRNVVVCRNGDLVRLAPGDPAIVDEVPAGRLYKDGRLLIAADARTVADRKRLSFSGIVTVALALTDKGQLAANPEVELIGIPETGADGDSMAEVAYEAAVETVESLPRPRRRDPDSVAEAVRRAVRAAVAARWGKKTHVTVQVLMV
jgi:ribonuclease J